MFMYIKSTRWTLQISYNFICQLYLNKAEGKVLFTRSLEMKYLGINLAKHVQNVYVGWLY